MEISKNLDGEKLLIALDGRLDTTSAPALEAEFKNLPSQINELTLDLEKLVYISSAGLRVILFAQKEMNKSGNMTIKNVCESVMDVFEITGFSDILNII